MQRHMGSQLYWASVVRPIWDRCSCNFKYTEVHFHFVNDSPFAASKGNTLGKDSINYSRSRLRGSFECVQSYVTGDHNENEH